MAKDERPISAGLNLHADRISELYYKIQFITRWESAETKNTMKIVTCMPNCMS